MKTKKFNIQTLLILILLVALISVTVFVVNKEKETIKDIKPEVVYVDKESEKTLENFTREHAVKALQETFISIGTDVSGKERTVEERLAALEKEGTKLEEVLTEETLSKVHISKDMREDYFNSTFLASSLLTYYLAIKEAPNFDNFNPVVETSMLKDAVYFDEEMLEAQIPFDVLTGDSRGIAFEMVYVDGEWKLNPYSAMMSLVMLVNYERQIGEAPKAE